MKKLSVILIIGCIFAVLLSGCQTEEKTETKNMEKALFLYTGEEYFIGDYVLSGNVAMFNESGIAEEIYYDDLRKVPDECFEINYWFNYGGMEHPVIEVLWDTDKVAWFSADMYSIDGIQNMTFNENGVFYRYDESEKKDTDRIYYFAETVSIEVSKTDITKKEYVTDAERYDNPMIECGEGEAVAYLMYFDESGDHYYRYDGKPCTLKAENTVITGAGDYVVSLSAESPVADVELAAICVELGEEKFPGYTYYITAITVDGVLCASAKPFTEPVSDGSSRTYIFSESDEVIIEDARCSYGGIDECGYMITSGGRLEDWTELKVYFTALEPGAPFDPDAKKQEIQSQLNG